MLTIGMKIKKLRELRNHTQEFMAGQLQMSANGYGKIERDETDVSFSRMQQIADIIGLTPSDIINFDENIIFDAKKHEAAKKNMEDYERNSFEQEINHLRQENGYLKEIISLMKRK